jgi:hypothetical protein
VELFFFFFFSTVNLTNFAPFFWETFAKF